MTTRRALVTGVGPGTGLATVRRLVEGGYEVAMIARNEPRLRELESQVPGSRAFAADVSDPAQLDHAIDRIAAELGMPELVVHNAVGGVFGNFMEIFHVAHQPRGAWSFNVEIRPFKEVW